MWTFPCYNFINKFHYHWMNINYTVNQKKMPGIG